MFAFIFPGQGSQQVGMGAELARQFPVARQIFQKADEALGLPLSRLCFEGPEEELKLTKFAQPAILTSSVAALAVLRQETGLQPVMVAGHSLGEYSALVCAEALDFEQAVRLVHQRGLFMQEAVPVGEGAMAAVMGVDQAAVEALCRDAAGDQVLCPANFNGGGQVVIAGHAAAVERAVALGKERGAVVKPLKVSAPFHCPLMGPAAKRLAAELAAVAFRDPKVPVIANVDAQPNLDGKRIAGLLAEQVSAAVQWEASVRTMARLGVKRILEIGCGKTLSSMIKRIDAALKSTKVDSAPEIEALKAPAGEELRPFVGPLGQWRVGAEGNLLSADGVKVMWAHDGRVEEVTEERWAINPNGTKVRRFGGMHVIWPDNRLETLPSDTWRARIDGAFVKKDGTRIISADGEVEEFDVAAWDVSENGTMRKKDGTRIILPNGIEWDFYDPRAHAFW